MTVDVESAARRVLAFAGAASGPLGDSLTALVDVLRLQSSKIRCAGTIMHGGARVRSSPSGEKAEVDVRAHKPALSRAAAASHAVPSLPPIAWASIP